MAASRPFSAYLHLWSLTNLLRISVAFNAGTGLVGSTLDKGAIALPLLILLAGCLPERCSGILPAAALLVRALTNIVKGSYMSNSQMWATQMDTAVLIALAGCVRVRIAATKQPSLSSLLAALTPGEESAIVASCAKTIRYQLSIFYFASGFWKVNTSFMDVSYSCASLFTVQPLEYLPDAILFATDGVFGSLIPLLARLIARIGPAATLVIESIVPGLHLLEPKTYPISAVIGVASTLAFHMVIGLTPPPSNVSSFGVTTCTRLFFMLPGGVTAAISELKSGGPSGRLLGAATVAAAAASLALVAPFHTTAVSTVQGEGVDWHLAYYACLCVLFARGCYLELQKTAVVVTVPATTGASTSTTTAAAAATDGVRNGPVEGGEEAPAYAWLVWLALLYAFALPVLGLQEKAGCLMFSQLRLHGGSNHYLLPTSLLQRAMIHAYPSNAFAGGVVRIESTDLEWVGNTFAEHMGPRTLRLIREVTGVPSEYVWAAKSTSLPRASPPPRFRRHTLSNLGLRKLLATAKAQKDAFTLSFTRLHGAVGDEEWRTRSSGVEYTVRGDGTGALSCHRQRAGGSLQMRLLGGILSEVRCDEREERLLGEPGSFSKALAFWLVPQPNPIIDGYTDEMHCVTWG